MISNELVGRELETPGVLTQEDPHRGVVSCSRDKDSTITGMGALTENSTNMLAHDIKAVESDLQLLGRGDDTMLIEYGEDLWNTEEVIEPSVGRQSLLKTKSGYQPGACEYVDLCEQVIKRGYPNAWGGCVFPSKHAGT